MPRSKAPPIKRSGSLKSITVELNTDLPGGNYLVHEAIKREISVRSLMFRILETIAADKMVDSILDDSDTLTVKRFGEHKFSRAHRSPI